MGNKHTIENFQYVPGRIDAAMQYVRHCMWLTDPIAQCSFSSSGRPLTPPEQAAYQAALEALRMYFSGEMDFGGAPIRMPEKAGKQKDRSRSSDESKDSEEDEE